LTLATVNNKN